MKRGSDTNQRYLQRQGEYKREHLCLVYSLVRAQQSKLWSVTGQPARMCGLHLPSLPFPVLPHNPSQMQKQLHPAFMQPLFLTWIPLLLDHTFMLINPAFGSIKVYYKLSGHLYVQNSDTQIIWSPSPACNCYSRPVFLKAWSAQNLENSLLKMKIPNCCPELLSKILWSWCKKTYIFNILLKGFICPLKSE